MIWPARRESGKFSDLPDG